MNRRLLALVAAAGMSAGVVASLAVSGVVARLLPLLAAVLAVVPVVVVSTLRADRRRAVVLDAAYEEARQAAARAARARLAAERAAWGRLAARRAELELETTAPPARPAGSGREGADR